MKRILVVILALMVIFAFAACGSNDGNEGENTPAAGGGQQSAETGKSWPDSSYIPAEAAYKGGGEIVQVVTTELGDMIFVNGASKADFDAYVKQLETAGIPGSTEDYGGGAYLFWGENEACTVNLEFAEEKQTTVDIVDGEMVDVEYNFNISFNKNGGTAASGGGAAAGGGEGNSAAVENTIDLSLDKDIYEKGERIEVSLDFGKLNQETGVIVIVPSAAEHGSEAVVHDSYEEYRWLADFSEIPFYMWAPDKDGQFDVRVYAGSEGGKELASLHIAVGDATPVKDEA